VRIASAGGGPGRAKRRISTSPPDHSSVWPGGSFRAERKIVSGAGIELKAR
jgi:hypothetical protein